MLESRASLHIPPSIDAQRPGATRAPQEPRCRSPLGSATPSSGVAKGGVGYAWWLRFRCQSGERHTLCHAAAAAVPDPAPHGLQTTSWDWRPVTQPRAVHASVQPRQAACSPRSGPWCAGGGGRPATFADRETTHGATGRDVATVRELPQRQSTGDTTEHGSDRTPCRPAMQGATDAKDWRQDDVRRGGAPLPLRCASR